MFASSSRKLEELQAQAQLVACRIRAGDTLKQAAVGLAAVAAPAHLAEIWALSLRQIDRGHSSSLSSIEAFSNLVRLEIRLKRQIESKTQLPKLQGVTLTLVTVLLAVIAFVLFPPALQPGPVELAVAVLLISASMAVTRHLLKRFENQLWLSDWALFLELMHHQMNEGNTWVSAYANLHTSPALRGLPQSLRKSLTELNELLQRGLLTSEWRPTQVRRKNPREFQQLDQLRLLGQLLAQGNPVTEIVAYHSQSAREIFEQDIERESNRLSMLLLGPLFLGQAPALLVLLFGPLLRQIW